MPELIIEVLWDDTLGEKPSPKSLGADRVVTKDERSADSSGGMAGSLYDLETAKGETASFLWKMEKDGPDLVGRLAAMGSVLTKRRPEVLTIRALPGDPCGTMLRIKAVVEALRHLGLRRGGIRLVSCPQCARSKVDFRPIAEKVSESIKEIDADLDVAVMGCEVNGPGEARMADLGVACGKGEGVIFKKGKVLRKVPESEIVDALLEEIRTMIR